jgi:hypothetical protein
MREVSLWRTGIACLIAIIVSFILYQHFCGRRVQAQSTTSTSILIPWITGDDADYTSLLTIVNTSMSPYSSAGTNGTCTAYAYYNGAFVGSGSLGTFNAGTSTTLTDAEIGTATGLSLANSGQKAYLYLTCTFPNAQAQIDFVNPGGVVTFIPGQPIPSSQSNPQFGPAPKLK